MPIYNERGESIAPVSIDGAGEKVQEVAAPAKEEAAAPAEPATAEASPDATPAREGEREQEPAAPANAGEKKEQSAEDNRRFAAERRAKETRGEVDAAVLAAQDALVAELGLTDGAGNPIKSFADYQKMKSSAEASRRAEQLRRAGIDADTLDAAIKDTGLPFAAEHAISAAEEARARAEEAEGAATLDREIAKISAIDPAIKSFDDLYAMPEYETFKALAGQFGFERAYKMATAERREAQIRQQAYNASVSKAHLGAVGKGGAEASYDISDADFAAYRQIFPSASRKEAAAAYKKYKK